MSPARPPPTAVESEPAGEELALDHAVAALLRGRWTRARACLDAPRLLAPSSRSTRVWVEVGRALLHAAEGRWEPVATRIANAAEDLRDAGPADSCGELVELLAKVTALAEAARSPSALSAEVRASGLELDLRGRLGLDPAPVEERLRALAARGAPVHLGRVRLLEVLGSGGLGQVWRGVHDGGAAVAVKLLHVDASTDRARRMVLEEVCTLAALDHPNVVWLLGYGFVDAAAERMGVGVAGAPYLVLELASGGTLAERGQVAWPETRAALLQILDGLAHAHARGRVHLDLKPANVLLAGSGAQICKIADFGLARWVGAVDRRPGAGTPAYMAPEQFRGRGRVGPRTDLYALGCLATELVVGAPPFGSGEPLELAISHHEQTPPPLPSGCAVPPGFDAWRLRLLAKDPEDRFGSAAEAAEALTSLAATVPLPARSEAWKASVAAAPTRLIRPGSSPATPGPHTLLFDRPEDVGPGPTTDVARRRRPVTLRFVTADPLRRSTLAEASLPLFALRAPPVVGRMRERQLLWTVLREVATRKVSMLVVLGGLPGVGASRLGEWLVERAAELDVARVVRRSPPGAATDPAGRLAADLGADLGLRPGVPTDDPALAAAVPDPFEREALVAAMGGTADERTVLRLWARHLERLAAAGPVLVLLDGLADADPARKLVAGAVGGPHPVLFVVVTSSDDDPLADLPSVIQLPLEPMPDDDLGALLDARLALDPRLRRELLDAAGGRPGTAVQILTDLVGRKALTPGIGGWNLAPGEAPRLPTDHRRALAERASSAGLLGVLGVLAVAGEADDEVLRRIAELAGEGFARDDLERAVALGLADRSEGGTRMPSAHVGAVLEVLDPARVRALHAAAATVAVDPERVARHRIGAGDPLLALEPLGRAVRAWIERPDRLAELLRAWKEALDAGSVPATDPRRAPWWLERAALAMKSGDTRALATALTTLTEGQEDHGWPIDSTRLGLLHGDLLRLSDQWEDAARMWQAAIEGGPPETPDGRHLHGTALHRLATAAERRGDTPGAIALLRRAIELQPRGVARSGSCVSLANYLASNGELGAARRSLEEAVDDAQGPIGQAVLAQGRGLLAAFEGDWRGAARFHREVVARFEVLGVFRPVARMNLVTALLAEGRDDEARHELHLVGSQIPPGSSQFRFLRELWIAEAAPAADDRFERLMDEHGTAPHDPLLAGVASRRAKGAGRLDRVQRLTR